MVQSSTAHSKMISYVEKLKYTTHMGLTIKATLSWDKNQVKESILLCLRLTVVSGKTTTTMERENIRIVLLDHRIKVLFEEENMMDKENSANGTTLMKVSTLVD